MRVPRLTSLSAVLLVVVVVLQVVVGPVAATGQQPPDVAVPGSPSSTVDAVEEWSQRPVHGTPVRGPTVETTFTFSQIEEAGVVGLRVQYDLPPSVSAFRLRIPELASTDTTVVETDGFERTDETTFEWTRSTSAPTLHFRLAVSTDSVSPSDHGIERDGWAFASAPGTEIGFSYSGSRPAFRSSASVDGPGFATDRMAFLGAFNRTDVTVDGETVRFVVGQGETSANLSSARQYLELAPGRFDFGVRRDRLVVFVLPFESSSETEETLVTGEAFGNTFWVTAGATRVDGPENAFAHEYVHTRLTTVGNGSARWLTEATAEYYGHLSTLNAGGTSYEAFSTAVRSDRFAPQEQPVVLSEPTSWRGSLANYEKGAHVLAALDAEIRTRTNGTRTLYDVFVTTQRFDDYGAFRAQVIETSGDTSLGPWLDEYVTTTALPPLPQDPTRFVQGADLDPDGDGLTSGVESSSTPATNPFAADTDGDGLTDAEELEIGTDPTQADTDGDTLTDRRELESGTDPLEADTDHDGTNDAIDAYPMDPASRTETPPPTDETETGDPQPDGTPQPTTESGTETARTAVATPGFGVVSVVGTLVLVGIWVRRQNQ